MANEGDEQGRDLLPMERLIQLGENGITGQVTASVKRAKAIFKHFRQELSLKAANRVIPVRVDGLKRIFNQETSWRSDHKYERAVCNVVHDSEQWINGVLVPDVTRTGFAEFQERESWYRLIETPRENIEAYRAEDEK